jgi:hypothetical protein
LNETLDGISIRYNISKDLIRKANSFSGDEIFMFKHLIIPFRGKTHTYFAKLFLEEEVYKSTNEIIDKETHEKIRKKL